MSESISQVNTSPGEDTFTILYTRTNEVIDVISTIAVTVNTHANGGLTTGNGWVEGTFGARNLVGNTIGGGDVATPDLLTITTNVESTGDTLVLGDISINSTDITINGVSVGESAGVLGVSADTTGTGYQLVDSFSKISYRGAEYVLTIKDQNANAYQISKLLVVHDTGDAYTTEYGAVYSNTEQGNFKANVDVTNVRVYFNPTSTNTHVSGSTILIPV